MSSYLLLLLFLMVRGGGGGGLFLIKVIADSVPAGQAVVMRLLGGGISFEELAGALSRRLSLFLLTVGSGIPSGVGSCVLFCLTGVS